VASSSELRAAALLRLKRETSLSPFLELLQELVSAGQKQLVSSNDDRQLAQAQGAVRILMKLQELIDQSERTGR